MSKKTHKEAIDVIRKHADIARKNGLRTPEYIDIKIDNLNTNAYGLWHFGRNLMEINERDKGDWLDTVKHEFVHALQEYNGVERGHGTSFDEMSDKAGMGRLIGRPGGKPYHSQNNEGAGAIFALAVIVAMTAMIVHIL